MDWNEQFWEYEIPCPEWKRSSAMLNSASARLRMFVTASGSSLLIKASMIPERRSDSLLLRVLALTMTYLLTTDTPLQQGYFWKTG
ncbi:hypothetical protein ACC771_17150, partial [Rhizobium ruizarguesonis]